MKLIQIEREVHSLLLARFGVGRNFDRQYVLEALILETDLTVNQFDETITSLLEKGYLEMDTSHDGYKFRIVAQDLT